MIARAAASLLLLTALLLPTFGQEPASPTEASADDPKDRAKSAREAVKAGTAGIARITPLLNDPEVTVRIEAVKAIVEIGSQYSLDPLRQALADSDAEVQIRATDGLVNFYLPGYVKTGLSGAISRTGAAVRAKFRSETDARAIEPWIDVRPEIIGALGKLLRESPNADAKANAARALGVLRGRAALEDLHAALRSKDSRLMYESLVALQKIRDPKSGAAVAFLFRDPEEPIAAAALETAGLVRAVEVAPDIELAWNRAPSVRIRRAALTALAALGDPKMRIHFAPALNDKDEWIRAAGAEGLARLNDKNDVQGLQKVFDEERRMPPRLAAAFGLVSHGRTETAEMTPLTYLINTLNSKAWSGVASGYLVELARTKRVRTAIEQTLISATKAEKLELIRVLGASGDGDSALALERLTRDTEPEVMESSVRALRALKARLP
jgi:HEAT repeat protein